MHPGTQGRPLWARRKLAHVFLPPTFVGDVRHSWATTFKYYSLIQKLVPAVIANGLLVAFPFMVLASAMQTRGYFIAYYLCICRNFGVDSGEKQRIAPICVVKIDGHRPNGAWAVACRRPWPGSQLRCGTAHPVTVRCRLPRRGSRARVVGRHGTRRAPAPLRRRAP